MAETLLQMSEEVFNLHVQFLRTRITKSNSTELSESQFLTLDLLTRLGQQNVGELQRAIGVLPAQMSRVIRSLESNFEAPLIRCDLNPQDKRKIDVTVTPEGQKVYDDYRQSRIARVASTMEKLNPQDQEEFVRICKEMVIILQASTASTQK